MDSILVSVWIIAGLIFIVAQRVLSARANRSSTLLWQVRLLVLCTVIPSGLFATYLLVSGHSIGDLLLVPMVVVMIFFTLLTYVLGIYSNFESSMSLKIFSIIAKKSNQHVTAALIKKEYPMAYIVERRISRLLAIGNIKKENGRYVVLPIVSVFSVRDSLGKVFSLFFPR